MISFTARMGMSFVYAVPRDSEAEINLSFLAADMSEVVLLLSLRQAEGIILANDCVGGVWGAELRSPLTPWGLSGQDGTPVVPVAGEAAGTTAADAAPPIPDAAFAVEAERSVAVLFEQDRIRVLIDGATHLRLPAERFGTGRIAAVMPGPGVRRSSLLVDGAALFSPEYASQLLFGPRFMVEGVEFNPLALQQGAHLVVEGLEDRLDCIEAESVATIEEISYPVLNLQAPLPGRIWAAGPATETRQIRLLTGAEELARLTVSKTSVLAAIDALAATGKPEETIFEALSAVEHVHFGGLFERLTPRAAAFIRDVVGRFALEEFLPLPPLEDAAAPEPMPTAQAPENAFAELVRDAFSAQVRAAPEADPLDLLRALLARKSAIRRW